MQDKTPKALGFDVPLGSKLASALPPEKRYDSRVLEYVDRMLREYDRNRDDILDKEEMQRVRWQNDPAESDLNRDGVLSKAELYERIQKRYGSKSSSDSSSSSSSRSSSGSSSSPSGSSSTSSAESDASKVRRYAESLLKQYDANKNGVLEKDEFSQMRGGMSDADTNRDGQITLDELTTKLSGYGKSDSSSSSSSGSSSSSSSGSSSSYNRSSSSGSSREYSSSRSSSKTPEKKSYRQLSPTERLPKGLPDWFIRNDTDGDGQIAMSEFSATWTSSKAAEFLQYDLNGDGLITPKECLSQTEKKK